MDAFQFGGEFAMNPAGGARSGSRSRSGLDGRGASCNQNLSLPFILGGATIPHLQPLLLFAFLAFASLLLPISDPDIQLFLVSEPSLNPIDLPRCLSSHSFEPRRTPDLLVTPSPLTLLDLIGCPDLATSSICLRLNH